MNIFYDIQKAADEMRQQLAKIDLTNLESPSAHAQLRACEVNVAFMSWTLNELNLETDREAIIHAGASIISNFIRSFDENFGDGAMLQMLDIIGDNLAGDTLVVGSGVTINPTQGGRA